MSENFVTYTLYDHPSDYPNHWVVRRFENINYVPVPDKEPYMVSTSLEEIMGEMERMGLTFVPRWAEDDPVIYGVFI